MGVALWVACGIVAVALARIIPIRRRSLFAEAVVAAATATLAGLVATALDFGGRSELDWRAGVFAFLVAAAAVGALRIVIPGR